MTIKTITTRKEKLAYDLAAWVCFRQQPITRRATVVVWAEANNIQLTDDEIDYAFEHWLDFIEREMAA